MNKFIEWDSLEFRKSSGKEKLRCPSCDANRSDKKDKSLLINHSDGFGKCFYCDSLTFRDSKKIKRNVTYKLPEQTWRNHTKLSDNLIKWVEDERKIRQSTLIDLGITEEKYYQPAMQTEANNLVFNYFEGETLVNKKYRSGSKNFTQSAGTKSIFYNINSVIGQEEVYIVEGEFDVLAMHNEGYKNVISVPNGANDNDEYWKNSEKYLKNIEKFIIATDNDEKGNELKDHIAQRLGRYRCEYIEWKNKDANGDLISGDFKESIKERKRFPVSGTFKISDLKDGIFELYNHGLPKTIYPKNECFGELKNIYSGMRGHLAVITGIPSHGKSNYAEWYVLNLIHDYKMKASFFSPEHSPMELHQTNFIQKAVGKNFWKAQGLQSRITEKDIERYIEWADEKIYITNPEKGQFPSWDWILEKFKEQMFNFGIDIFVIDAFNKLELPKGNKIDAINTIMTKITMFAQMNNVMIFLVVHPTKMTKKEDGTYSVPSLYDCSGSADFRNQTHDGFTIYRYFPTQEEPEGKTSFINLKTKFSYQGEIGKSVDFNYDVLTGRYYAQGESVPSFDMTRPDEEQVQMMPNLSFDDTEEDMPF